MALNIIRNEKRLASWYQFFVRTVSRSTSSILPYHKARGLRKIFLLAGMNTVDYLGKTTQGYHKCYRSDHLAFDAMQVRHIINYFCPVIHLHAFVIIHFISHHPSLWRSLERLNGLCNLITSKAFPSLSITALYASRVSNLVV